MSAATGARLQNSTLRVAAIALFAAATGFAISAFVILRSPDFPLLTGSPDAQWITAPLRIETNAIPVHPEHLPIARLSQRFELPGGGPLEIRVNAMRGYELSLNDRVIASREPTQGNWKREERIVVRDGLARENELQVVVRNTTGPAALRLALSAPDFELASDASWTATNELGVTRAAIVADDTRPYGPALGGPTSWQQLLRHRDTVVLFATLCGLLSLWLTGRPPPSPAMLLGVAWAVAGALWLVVFGLKGGRLPAFVGYDGPAHLEYVRFLIEQGRLPHPEEGFSMYHPPLFYALAAAISSAFGGGVGADDATRRSAEMLIRIVPVLSGFSQLGIAYLLARKLFRDTPQIAAIAVLLAALLPVNLTMSMYVSNEPLNAALAGAVLLATTDLLLREGLPLRRIVALAALLALALLTKATSLLLLPLVGIALCFKHFVLDRGTVASFAVRLGLGSVVLALLCGWYFVRNLLHSGEAAVGNWNITYNQVGWFQFPGFHTPAYYTHFGSAIERPYFAGFRSFWDGMYSTFWGDGLLGGVIELSKRHSLWNYDYMSMIYLLALPATLILVVGIAGFCLSRASDSRRRLAMVFLGTAILAYGAAVLVMTLRLPFYAQAKASYALSVVAPTAVAGAYCFARLDAWLAARGLRWLRIPLHAWAGAFAITVGVAFGG